MNSTKKAGHVRENHGVLARVEKKTLIWIAERLPLWINSDHLSLLGLTAMVVAGGAFWAARLHPAALLLVVVALAVNWFGDSLDGTVARVRNHQRPRYGFYVDHVIDVVGAFFLFSGMALSPYMSPVVALVLLVAYLMLCAETYLATHSRGVFRLSMFRMGPTELRILLSIGVLCLLYKPMVVIAGIRLLLFDVGGVVAIVSMFFALFVSTVRNTLALYRAEPLPHTKPVAREAKQWTNARRHAV